jgi:hypothetical protein
VQLISLGTFRQSTIFLAMSGLLSRAV